MIVGVGIGVLGIWLVLNGGALSLLEPRNGLLCLFLIMPFAAVTFAESVQIWARGVQEKLGSPGRLPNFLYLVSALGLPWYAFITAHLVMEPTLSYSIIALVSIVMILITFVRIDQNRILEIGDTKDQVGALPFIAATSVLCTAALMMTSHEKAYIPDLIYICVSAAALDFGLKLIAKNFFHAVSAKTFHRLVGFPLEIEGDQKTTAAEDVLTPTPQRRTEFKSPRYEAPRTQGYSSRPGIARSPLDRRKSLKTEMSVSDHQ